MVALTRGHIAMNAHLAVFLNYVNVLDDVSLNYRWIVKWNARNGLRHSTRTGREKPYTRGDETVRRTQQKLEKLKIIYQINKKLQS